MRRLALVLGLLGALWLAPGALAAGWCGTGESGRRPARHRHLPPGPRDRRSAFRRARHVRGAGEPGRGRRNLDGRLVGRSGPDPDPAVRPGAVLGLAVRRHLVRPPAEPGRGLFRHRRERRLPEHRAAAVRGRVRRHLQEVPRLLLRLDGRRRRVRRRQRRDRHRPVIRRRHPLRLSGGAERHDRDARAAARARGGAAGRSALPGGPGTPVRLAHGRALSVTPAASRSRRRSSTSTTTTTTATRRAGRTSRTRCGCTGSTCPRWA